MTIEDLIAEGKTDEEILATIGDHPARNAKTDLDAMAPVLRKLDAATRKAVLEAVRNQQERSPVADGLIQVAVLWQDEQQAWIAHRASVFITAINRWRETGEGDAPDIKTI